MKGFEEFFSPLRPLPTKRKTAPPWEGEQNHSICNNNSSISSSSNTKSNGDPDPDCCSSADCPPQLPALVRPELAPNSDSSGGSVPPSPVREFRRNGSNLENNKELRRRLIARASQPPVLKQAWRQHRQRDPPPRRPWPFRACLCRICSCLSILVLLGVIIVLRLVASFTSEKNTLPAILSPVGDTDGHLPPTPASVPEREASASSTDVQGNCQPNSEEKSGHPDFMDTMPASPVEAPVVSKTPTLPQVAKGSADPVDAIPTPVGDTDGHLPPTPASVPEREVSASISGVQGNFRPDAEEKSAHSISMDDTDVHLAPPTASVSEREASASIPGVNTIFRPNDEEKSRNPDSMSTMPASPVEAPVVSKTPTSPQAAKESADSVDAIPTPVGDTDVHLAPPTASVPERGASASIPDVHGNFRLHIEEKRGHSVSRDTMPALLVEAPVVSKTRTSPQATKESADAVDAIPTPVGGTDVHLALPTASVPKREASASMWDVKGNFRPDAEEKSGHPDSMDTMPASPVKEPVVSKTPTLPQAAKESSDPVDAIPTPVGDTDAHRAPPTASVPEREAPASIPGVKADFRPDAEEKSGHSVSGDMMPASPVEAPMVSETSASRQVAKQSADPADVEKESQSQDEQCWIFMHMERSGGAAVRQIATERWRKDELVYDTVQWRRGDTYAEDVMVSHWKLLHGGCVEAVRNDEARACKWITIFRHPVARLLSAYDYCQEAPRDPLCPPIKSADLATFAERWGNFAVRQFALATVSPSTVKAWAARGRKLPQGTSVWYLVQDYLTRGGVALEDAVLEEDVLESANKTLSTYAAVGIATELDATMRLFDKALPMEGLDWSSSLRKLRGQDDGGKDAQYDNAASAKFQEAVANPRISSALRLDMLLFDHAVEVFQGQVAHYNI